MELTGAQWTSWQWEGAPNGGGVPSRVFGCFLIMYEEGMLIGKNGPWLLVYGQLTWLYDVEVIVVTRGTSCSIKENMSEKDEKYTG